MEFINLLSIIGLFFSINLIRLDIKDSNYCPKIFNIPACYLVLISFAIVLISNTILSSLLLFMFGSALGLILGLWFTYNEIRGSKKCPRFFNVPLCYVSLVTFILLIVIKLNFH